jgi:competence protein ComEC
VSQIAPGTGDALWIVLFLLLISGYTILRRRGRTASYLGPVLLLAGLYGGVSPQLPSEIDRVPREQSVTGTLLRSPEPSLENTRILLVRGRETDKAPSDPLLLFRLKVQPSTPDVMAALDRLQAGDLIQVWCKAGVPSRYGNPGASDPALYLAAAGINKTGRVKSARLVERIAPGDPSPARWVDQARSFLRRGLTRTAAGDPRVTAVLCAMLLGERGGLDRSTLGTLRRAGLVHLIAVSGLHVGLILVVILWVLRKLPLPTWFSLVAVPVILAGLILLTGGRASVLRAASTAFLAATGRSIGRKGNMVNTLCMAALWMMLLNPAILIDAGFQLSFGATFGIVLGWRRIRTALPLPVFPAGPLAISTAAYLGTAPLLALRFGTLAPISVVTNLFSSLLCGVILLCGYPAAVLAMWTGDGRLPGSLATLACRVLLRLADHASEIPYGALRVSTPSVIVFICTLAIPLLLARENDRPAMVSAVPAAVAFVALTFLHLGQFPAPLRNEPLQLVLPDVGQGQAVLLRQGDATILVDAGGSRSRTFDPGERIVCPMLADEGIHRLELLAISHEHLDHAGGAAAVLREFEVGQLWLTPGVHAHPLIRSLMDLALSRGTSIVLAEQGTAWSGIEMRVQVLYPAREDADLAINDRSMVLVVQTDEHVVILPGDLERNGEERLLQSAAFRNVVRTLDVDVLVTGHHGARNSSTEPFLAKLKPDIALVSAGKRNRFGHPDPGTIERLERSGATVYLTSLDGMVRLEASDSKWIVLTENKKAKVESTAGR